MGSHNHHGLLIDQSVINAIMNSENILVFREEECILRRKTKKSIAFSQQLIEQLGRISQHGYRKNRTKTHHQPTESNRALLYYSQNSRNTFCKCPWNSVQKRHHGP